MHHGGHTKNNQRLETIESLCDAMQPSSTVEKESFWERAKTCHRESKQHNCSQGKAGDSQTQCVAKNKLVKCLDDQDDTIMCSHWTSLGDNDCTSLTAHFIDADWELHDTDLGLHLCGVASGLHKASHSEITFDDNKW